MVPVAVAIDVSPDARWIAASALPMKITRSSMPASAGRRHTRHSPEFLTAWDPG